MTKSNVNKIVKELTSDGRHSDEEAYDIAGNTLFDEDGLEDAIRKHFNVQDPQGWLADKIS